jgi:Peptidase family S41
MESPVSYRWLCYAIGIFLFADSACHGGAVSRRPIAQTAAAPNVANLHTFARLYGVLRWFHPSDAATIVDWDRFAIDGARRVVAVRNAHALRLELVALIAPFAPTVGIAGPGEQPVRPAAQRSASAFPEIVAWQHRGFGDSTLLSVYASKRRHRDSLVPVGGAPFAALWQSFDAMPLRGAQVRLRGKVRAANHGRGQLWLRIETKDGTAFFDNMDRRPVVSPTWTTAEIVGLVSTDATRIVVGTLMSGAGTTWYDDIELATQAADGSWTPLEIKDPGFESGNPFASWRPGVGQPRLATTDGWNVVADRSQAASGSVSLRVEAATKIVREELFADAPPPREMVDVDLGSGLGARVPLALASRDGHTVGDDPAVARRSQESAPIAASGYDVMAGVADVIVAWNALQHFWPYWDVVSVDWNAALDAALADALDDRSVDEHVATLQRLSAAAPDAHAGTVCPGESPRAFAPFLVDVIADQIVVTASADKAVVRGDVIVSVDGRPAGDEWSARVALISGSSQWRRFAARAQFGAGPIGSILALQARRAGRDINVTVARIAAPIVEERTYSPIERFDNGVYYVDLGRASMPEINAVMDGLAGAPGVVFDVRGRPNSNHAVLSHLLARPDNSTAWMAVPHVIRPDHTAASMPSWDLAGWSLPVREPHIAGRVAFVTGPGAVSYAESIMAFVEHYHLGAIVGSTTAGTNGNIAEITGPTGCRTRFTGMRVTKHSGARLHLVGIEPTIPASRTIDGVIAGRDEIVEKAIAYVRGSSK